MTMPYTPLLDNWVSVTGTNTGGVTTWDYTFHDQDMDTVVLGADFGATAGTVITGLANPTHHSVTIADATGAYAGHAAYVGRGYTMTVELSQPYPREQDGSTVIDGELQLEWLGTIHDATGRYNILIDQPGRTQKNQTFTNLAIEERGRLGTFVHGNSKTTTVKIQNTTPLPSNIVAAEYLATFTPRSKF